MVRHILGISGGKDSAALAIYLKNKYPQMKLEYAEFNLQMQQNSD